MTLADDCAREVVALHEAMEAWFTGRGDEEAFDRIESALAPAFEIVSPDGEPRGFEETVASIEAARGSQSPEFEIEIRNVETRVVEADLCQLRYEEWQHVDGEETGRVSSVLFRRQPEAPGGVEWLHLHETWLGGPE